MKLLVWNIKFFTKSRVTPQTSLDDDLNKRKLLNLNDGQRAMSALTYIFTTVQQADPDIFVVLEPRASAGDPGTLAEATSGGPSGLIYLLTYFKLLDQNWWLVPPQRINEPRVEPDDPEKKGVKYTECVGVYWRSDRLTFTGPWANTAQGIRPATAFPAIAYGAPWNGCVPINTTAAGRCLYFKDNQGSRIGFPDQHSRIPFCTTFTEIGGGQRSLALYSVHCDTYKGGEAAYALTKLPFEQGKNIYLIAGDFNIDVSAPTTGQSTYLGELGQSFGNLYPGPAQKVFGKLDQYPPTLVYSHKYAQVDKYTKNETLDFGMLNCVNTPVPQPTCFVVDRVAGAPQDFSSAMLNPLGDFLRQNNPLDLATFRSRDNYAKIGTPAKLKSSPAILTDGTSDHLPILLTV